MSVDALSTVFAALADPTRRAIIVRLAEGDASVSELAEPFALSLPTISRHLKVLEHSDLITRKKDAQRRVCKLNRAAFDDAGAFIQRYVSFWKSSLEALATHVESKEKAKWQKKRAR